MIAGLVGIAYDGVDTFMIHSPAKIEKRVEQLVPGYNPKQFRLAEQVVVDFSQQTRGLTMEGAKTIEPKKAMQAETFIREQQETYDTGRILYDKRIKKKLIQTFIRLPVAAVAIVIGSAVFVANSPSKAKELITPRGKSNPAQTQS